MNSTDLHASPPAPAVSRTTFFTQLLMEPRPQRETSFEEPAPAEPTAPPAEFAPPTAAGFSA